jgi:hypothetical protein
MSNGAKFEKIMKTLEDHEKRLSKLEQVSQTKTEGITSKPNIRDFIRANNPKDDVQKTLAIGYYLEKYENFLSFNGKDLTKGFRDAKEIPPQNVNDKANKNKDKHYLMDAAKKKDGMLAWVLTAKGEEYVESGFQETR